MTPCYFTLNKEGIFIFHTSSEKICKLWEFKQEMNLLAHIPINDWRDFRKIGDRIAILETEAIKMLENE